MRHVKALQCMSTHFYYETGKVTTSYKVVQCVRWKHILGWIVYFPHKNWKDTIIYRYELLDLNHH